MAGIGSTLALYFERQYKRDLSTGADKSKEISVCIGEALLRLLEDATGQAAIVDMYFVNRCLDAMSALGLVTLS